jgi:two-component system, NarL family, response regulator NreC
MLPTKKLQILLVDADLATRNVARTEIKKHSAWMLTGEADTVAEALELTRTRKPDLIVLDHGLTLVARVPVIPRIIAAAPKARLVVLISNPSEEAIRTDLRAGAVAFLLKFECKNRLATAIKQAASGQRFFSGQISRIILRRFLYPSTNVEKLSEISDGLTPRELEIVRLITLGNGNKQVAAQLGITVRTAEAHRANVMRKLNLHNLAEIVHYALLRGLIKIDAAGLEFRVSPN